MSRLSPDAKVRLFKVLLELLILTNLGRPILIRKEGAEPIHLRLQLTALLLHLGQKPAKTSKSHDGFKKEGKSCHPPFFTFSGTTQHLLYQTLLLQTHHS
jgi:hypothetical protein